MHYGYIGLGNLGAACAGCLLNDGFAVTVFDLNTALAAPLLAKGATLAKSAEDLAASVDHVITCLPSPAVSERVLRMILPHMRPGSSWVEMSTLGRDEVLTLAAVAAEAGVRMLELPVTGGVHLAYQGKITMLAGGDKDLFDVHHKAMQAMGDRIFHMGPLGSACLIKVITNMLAFIHLKATSEALIPDRRFVHADGHDVKLTAFGGNVGGDTLAQYSLFQCDPFDFDIGVSRLKIFGLFLHFNHVTVIHGGHDQFSS